MRTVSFRDGVLFPVCHELGIDVANDLNKEHASALFSFIHNWTEDAWTTWPWPDLNLTEERGWRRNWYDDEQYVRANAANFNLPDQLYFLTTDSYYQVKPTAPADPPIGTPVTDATYFEPLTTFDRYLELDQPGKQAIGLVFGIFNRDPSLYSGYSLNHELGDNGLEIFGYGGNTVWIRYQVRPSMFSGAVEYDPGTAYKKGQLVYDGKGGSDSGEIYRALANTTGNAPPNNNYWHLQPMPEVIAKYVMYNAAADYAEDSQTEARLRGKAERALTRAVDKLLEQGAKFPRYAGASRGGRRLITRIAVPDPVCIP